MNLSKVYRYNLSNVEKTIVPIAEELKFLEMYVNIMKIRLGNCFFVTQDFKVTTLQGSIPPCSLQMLVENALKHNTHTIEKPLLIAITANDKYISISNTKQPLDVHPVSTNVGNTNLRERYSLLSKNNIIIP